MAFNSTHKNFQKHSKVIHHLGYYTTFQNMVIEEVNGFRKI